MTNTRCWKAAQRYLAGGVNSPVRSFRAVGGHPFFVDRGDGPYLWDVEGRRYLDFVGSWGAAILGHRPPAVLRAVGQALRKGTAFGTPTPAETEMACAVCEAVPSMEQVRFVSSGTEAVMSAIRLARAATGRRKILKFDGGYHGHSDALLAQAGSGMATLGLPASPGVPRSVARETITVPFNDPTSVERAFRRHGKELACVIVEPVLANVGVIPPAVGFLPALRYLTRDAGALLIFDEVITGFRVAYGGAQAASSVKPDLTVLGKVIGGGFAVGAYGGRRDLMQRIAPTGPVYQAGTLSGHPVTMAAGLATLKELRRPGTYERFQKQTRALAQGLVLRAHKAGMPIRVRQATGMLTVFFTDRPIRNALDARAGDGRRYARYFRRMLERGIYLPPSPCEAWFLSTALGEREVERTLQAHEEAVRAL